MKIDMHVHTSGSFDCLNDPHAVVERAIARGMDRICVTDHNEIAVAQELQRTWPDRVIVGEEVKTAERVDVIGLFLSERIPKGTPARETCERIRGQGGIVYIPHPFAGGKGAGGAILDRIEDLIDAFEGFNARIHDAALNHRAVAWAHERHVPLGAGSDAHTLREVGRAWAEVPPFDGARDFTAALRRGTIHGAASSRAVHLASGWAKAHKWLRRS
ncbi:MAG: PHP domain-containing protein [Longimicrobiales bacterium]